MKRILFFLFLGALNFPVFSRENLLHPKSNWFTNGPSDQSALMLSGGYFQGNFKLLNNYMHRFGNNSGFSFFRTAGLDFVIPIGSRNGDWNSTMNVETIIPQEITQGDSMKFRMTGWHFISSWYCHDFLPDNEKLALEFAPGVDWGELNMKVTDKVGPHDYKNPFIAPLARTEFRVIQIGRAHV